MHYCAVYIYIYICVRTHIYCVSCSTQCPMADKVALCCMLALCRVSEPHTQQSYLSFPAECQFPGPPLGEKKKSKMLEHLLKLKAKCVVTKLEHKLYSFLLEFTKENIHKKKKKKKKKA